MSWMSASCGAGRVPDAVIFVSSVTEATAAVTVGMSLVPWMVTVKEPGRVTPWLLETL